MRAVRLRMERYACAMHGTRPIGRADSILWGPTNRPISRDSVVQKKRDTYLVIWTTRLSSNPTLSNRQLIRTRGARGACDRRASALSATEQLGVHSSTSARYRGWDVEASMTSTVSSCVCFCPTSTAGAPAKTSSMRSGPSSEAYETEQSRFVLGPRPPFRGRFPPAGANGLLAAAAMSGTHRQPAGMA